MPARLSPGRLVAIGSVLVLLVVFAFWFARGGGTDTAVRPTAGASESSTPSGTSTGTSTPDSGLATIRESRLPAAARSTLVLIRSGGPFPYAEDGQTFQNREGLLPDRKRGYYKEYTVKQGTKGDRGPLRIVGGSGGDLYWTEDHYDSFRQIEVGR